MPLVRHFAEGESYELQPGEVLLQLGNTADVPLYIGIRKGEFLIAQPADEPQLTYVLTEEQHVRLQQQLKLQVTYKGWLKTGLLTITDVTVPPDPPPPDPEVEDPPPEALREREDPPPPPPEDPPRERDE